MGTSCAEINPYLLMCAEGSEGAMNVKEAFSEGSSQVLVRIHAFS